MAIALLLLCVAAAHAQQDNNLVYQIFVRSFADTPSDTAPPSAKGEIGDLRGIVERFNYLNDGRPGKGTDLEVGIVWLMPIFPSGTYHGYDIEDYRAVNPDYGSMGDLEALIQTAHQRGVRIILDIAFNHTSDRHPWFREAIDNPDSRFRSFYHIREDDETLSRRWRVTQTASGKTLRYLGVFSEKMPDLNLAEHAVREELKSIAKFWLDRGIDGFRLDAAKHIFDDGPGGPTEDEILKNNDWWREFSDFVYSVNPKAVLVGEVLGNPETLRRNAYGLDALLDQPFLHAVRNHVVAPRAGFLKQWTESQTAYRAVNDKVRSRDDAIRRRDPFQTFVYAASHDENPRLLSFLEQRLPAQSEGAYRLAFYLLFSMGKYPVIYNGDEVMQRGWKWRGNPPDAEDEPGDGSRVYDETLREPFPWFRSRSSSPQTGWFPPRYDKPNDGVSVEEQGAAGGMLHLTRALAKLRTTHLSYANGEISAVLTDSEDWLVFEKRLGNERYLVLVNTMGAASTYHFHADWHPEYSAAKLIFWSDGAAKKWKDESERQPRIQGSVRVPPYGMVLLKHP